MATSLIQLLNLLSGLQAARRKGGGSFGGQLPAGGPPVIGRSAALIDASSAGGERNQSVSESIQSLLSCFSCENSFFRERKKDRSRIVREREGSIYLSIYLSGVFRFLFYLLLFLKPQTF